MNSKQYYVYIMTNASHSVTYTGVTNDLIKRVWQHNNNLVDGFTKKYRIHCLVYYDQTDNVYAAISREKEIKGWLKSKKIALINEFNPSWSDLYDGICGNDDSAEHSEAKGRGRG
jgi:putative endonuclease